MFTQSACNKSFTEGINLFSKRAVVFIYVTNLNINVFIASVFLAVK